MAAAVGPFACVFVLGLAAVVSGCGKMPRESSSLPPPPRTRVRTATRPAPTAERRVSSARRAQIQQVKAYERAYKGFVYHADPLRVAQTEAFEDRPGYVIARVPVRHFLCDLTPRERSGAIKAFYDKAAARLRGERPIRMTVAEASEETRVHHVFAHVRNGVVILTAEGVRRPPCR